MIPVPSAAPSVPAAAAGPARADAAARHPSRPASAQQRFEAQLAQEVAVPAATTPQERALPPLPDPRGADAAAALQGLLALPVRWPLPLPSPQEPAALAVTAHRAPALTAHDVAAAVRSAWVQEPLQTTAAVQPGAHWTFGIDDPMTPLATLRVSGDAQHGWRLQLTATAGMAPRELALRGEQLRGRLQARGQAVRQLTVDEDEERR